MFAKDYLCSKHSTTIQDKSSAQDNNVIWRKQYKDYHLCDRLFSFHQNFND